MLHDRQPMLDVHTSLRYTAQKPKHKAQVGRKQTFDSRWVWWLMPGGAVLERLRQEDCYKCEASLVYILGHRIKPCLFCVQKQTETHTHTHTKGKTCV